MKKIEIEELKKIQLNIMNEIDSFCRKNNIDYYLTGGTLIGAVRHKGYIPWDDDIDIFIKRNDYNKFIKNFGIRNNIEIINPDNTKDYYLSFAKAIDNRTVLKEEVDSKLEIGVYVDIFPIDNIPRNKINKILRTNQFYINLLKIKNSKIKKRNIFKNTIIILCKFVICLISKKYIINKIIKSSTKYSNEECDMIANLNLLVYKYGDIWEKNWYDGTTELEFEGKKYLVPIEYDKVLRKTFGDYMQLPPKEKQIAHHEFEAWYK